MQQGLARGPMKQNMIIFILIYSFSFSWAQAQNETPDAVVSENDPIEEVFQLAGMPSLGDRDGSVDYLVVTNVKFTSAPSQILRRKGAKVNLALPAGLNVDVKSETLDLDSSDTSSLSANSLVLSQFEIQDPASAE